MAAGVRPRSNFLARDREMAIDPNLHQALNLPFLQVQSWTSEDRKLARVLDQVAVKFGLRFSAKAAAASSRSLGA